MYTAEGQIHISDTVRPSSRRRRRRPSGFLALPPSLGTGLGVASLGGRRVFIFARDGRIHRLFLDDDETTPTMTTMTTDAQPSVRLVATDELGIVRVAQAPSTQALGSLSMTHRWGDASRARRIVTCRAGEAGDDVSDDGLTTCAANGWLAVGRHDATVTLGSGV